MQAIQAVLSDDWQDDLVYVEARQEQREPEEPDLEDHAAVANPVESPAGDKHPADDAAADVSPSGEAGDAYSQPHSSSSQPRGSPSAPPVPSALATSAVAPFSLVPFRADIGPERELKALLRLSLQHVGQRTNRAGWIYGFRRVSEPDYLKVGVTLAPTAGGPAPPAVHPVDARIAKWQSDCGATLEEVFRAYMPCAARRIEGLIHAQHLSLRRVQDPPCGRCRDAVRNRHGRHNEWFETGGALGEARLRAAVETWRLWSEERPYDGFGRISAFWADKTLRAAGALAAGQGLVDTTDGWVMGLPAMIWASRAATLAEVLGRLFL
jgi:hypothetical protein